MQQIAEKAGVSKATVSLALRDSPLLLPETRRRIQAISREMGYRTNATVANLMAQLRASRAPKYQATLALINASSDPDALENIRTFRDWVTGCAARAGQLGYGLDRFWLHAPDVTPARLAAILASRNISGLIVAAISDGATMLPKLAPFSKEFATVVIGKRTTVPPLHHASNDQYSTAMHCFQQLIKLGYKRPGLVLNSRVDELIDHRFRGGYLLAQDSMAAPDRVPAFLFSAPLDSPMRVQKDLGAIRKRFATWRQRHQPDAIITLHAEVKEWLEDAGTRIPKEIGLVHLDRTDDMENWAGMRQNNDLVGMAALDLVVGQLHRNEAGIPPFPKCMLIESTWVDGATVRKR